MTPRSFSRVEQLYHAVLARPPNEREPFLNEACRDDEELLREVKSLLGYEEEAKRLLEEPVTDAATQKLAVVRGARLGPYEVLDLLGAGGMGEVYRARDTRLGRDVAVKVLPEHVARDPEALKRLDREAQAVAALSHPHIAALFDIGETDGTHYLVMELLEGQTLAERLKRGPLPEKEALRIGAEITEALGAAHGQGVVHRDVKPANVMLTRSGVKLLDFGLARLPPRPKSPGEPETATTGFAEGVVAGTLLYMSPEQLEGRATDARTDVWALGCVLFEMLTGERAFEGDTPAHLVATIEKDEAPSAAARRAGTSAALDRLVRQCLKKDPAERWSSAHDLALRLREIGEADTAGEARRRPWIGHRRAVPTVAALVVGALLVGVLADRLWLRHLKSALMADVVRSSIDLTPERPLWSSREGSPPLRRELALSPDGSLLAWAGRTDDDPRRSSLYLRRLDSGEVKRLPGTDGASDPFFSPDSRWIGFVQPEGQATYSYRLRKIPAVGGIAVDLATLPWEPKGATWGHQSIFLGSTSVLGATSGGIHRVPAEGGAPREITTVDRTREAEHQLPSILPGDRALVFTSMPHAFGFSARVEVSVLASGERKVLIEDAADARYLPTGHLVFVRRGVLMAAPFDLDRLELTASPVPVVDGVSQALGATHGSAGAQFSVSESGLLVYASGGISPETQAELLLVDEDGRTAPLPDFDKPLISPQIQFSPDGSRLAFVEQAGAGRLWTFDIQRHTYQALSDRGTAGSPEWSPDGSRLAVAWSEVGPLHIWLVPTGRGDWEQLTDGRLDDWPRSWSPDGRLLAFVRESETAGDVFLYRFEDRQIVPFLTSPAHETTPEFSPDGRWLAYASNESGRFEVYVTSFPGRERTITVSRRGGIAPAWSRDGKRLFYYSSPPSRDGRRSMMAVTVTDGPDLALGRPTVLFLLPDGFESLEPMRAYTPHPDGRHFVVGRFVKTEPQPPITRLTLVHNWFTELDRLCPTGR